MADNALRDGRQDDLQRILGRILDDSETIFAAVIDSAGQVVAGVPSPALECVPEFGASVVGRTEERRGWTACRGEVIRWVSLPLRDLGTRMVLGRRETVVTADMAASRVRILLTTLLLGSGASLVLLLVLRTSVTIPLGRIMTGVRTLGGAASIVAIQVPRSAGELRDLAEAFNEMAERLEGKRRALVREVVEGMAG